MKRSNMALRLAAKLPPIAKGALWIWARGHLLIYRDAQPPDHWFFSHLANILGYRIPVRTRLGNGMKIRVACNDYVGGTILRFGYYEPEMVELIEKLLKPGMVFFDVGAHVGQYTLVVSQLVGPEGQVHSFEPDPNTFRWLAGNIRLNRLENVRANSLALSDEMGTKQFYFATPEDTGSNSLSRPKNDSGRSCEVRCLTVDGYLQANRIGRVDLIKVDIEGAEYAMLSGAKQLLESSEKPVIIAEFEEARQRAFGSSCTKLANLLTGYGYRLFRVSAPPLEAYVPRMDDAPSFNILAVPSHRTALLVDLQRLPLRENASASVGR